MSAIYHTEPPTQGKVLVKTTFGDIDIELWAKEAPLACRNFVQLALEGYYDNTLVNRVIKGFMVQMGDPTGLGTGGDSIWSRPFKDEFHGRIKFNHRGQVAMANENAPNTNRSQFFITLDPCEWLNRKHTIFGKVTGVTMFNVVKMGEVEVDSASDKPLDPVRILRIEVLSNPFDDIVPRVSVPQIHSESPESVLRPTRKPIKNSKLLSFGDDSDDEQEVFIGKIKSSHDSKFKTKFMSSKVASEITQTLKAPHHSSNRQQETGSSSGSSISSVEHGSNAKLQSTETVEENFDSRMKYQLLKRLGDRKENKITVQRAAIEDPISSSNCFVETDVEKLNDIATSVNNDRGLAEKSAELKRLREDLLRSKRAVNVTTGSSAEQTSAALNETDFFSPLEQRRQKYLKRKQVSGSRDEETMNKLQAFTANLRASKKRHPDLLAETKSEADHYRGQVLEGTEGEKERDENLQNWHSEKLKFKRHVDDSFRNGADGHSVDDYSHVDMRHAHANR